jgi:O-acetyl-ADP-ribose deacetylase (regulator of RNase III)
VEARRSSRRIVLIQGDITVQEVDAVVNAANPRLQLGGGVAGAIRRRGGPRIQQECNALGGTAVGTAVITGAGDLPARHVIHAVGPRMGEGDEDAKLERAVRASLELAQARDLDRIALPAISTGIFGYPLPRCAAISCSTALDLEPRDGPPREVRFVLFDGEAYRAFAEALTEAARLRPDVELSRD